MPLISLRTSLASIDRRDEMLLELSAMLARETGKPEDYVMTLLETDVPMTFGGSLAPAAFVEVKSIGALHPPAMTAAFSELIAARTGIPNNRIYICFVDIPANSFGWNGKTFG